MPILDREKGESFVPGEPSGTSVDVPQTSGRVTSLHPLTRCVTCPGTVQVTCQPVNEQLCDLWHHQSCLIGTCCWWCWVEHVLEMVEPARRLCLLEILKNSINEKMFDVGAAVVWWVFAKQWEVIEALVVELPQTQHITEYYDLNGKFTAVHIKRLENAPCGTQKHPECKISPLEFN